MTNTLTTLRAIESELTNLQPHIPQACYPGREGFIDVYVDVALEKLRTLIASMEAQPEQACYCNADVSLQMVSGGGAPEGYLGKVTLRIGDQYRDFYTHPAQPSEPKAECWCTTCRPITMSDMRFVTCPDCGNKRCPKAHNHTLACTNSNEPGQPGSSWEGVKPASEPKTKPAHDDLTIAYMSGFHDGKKAKAEPVQEPVADADIVRDHLVAVSACIAEQDVVGAQAMLGDVLRMLTAPQARKPLTTQQIDEAVTNWFSSDWAQKAARGMLEDLDIEGGAA